jgi:hypothetical protein
MAWGSFIKKVKAFGDKVAKGIGSASKYMQEKVIPTVKKVSDVVSPMLPYGGAIQKGIDWLDTTTRKTQDFEDSSDIGELAFEETGLKNWMQKQKRK